MLRARAALVLAAAALAVSCKKEPAHEDPKPRLPTSRLHFYGGRDPVVVQVDMTNYTVEPKSAYVVDLGPGTHHVLSQLGWGGDVVVGNHEDIAVPISPKQCFVVIERSKMLVRIADHDSHPVTLTEELRKAPYELGQLPCNASLTPRQTVRAVTNNAVFSDVIIEGMPFVSADAETGSERELAFPVIRTGPDPELDTLDRLVGTPHTAVIGAFDELTIWAQDHRAALWSQSLGLGARSLGAPNEPGAERARRGQAIKTALATNKSSPDDSLYALDSFGLVAIGPEHTQAADHMFQGVARERQPGVYFVYRFGEGLYVSGTTKRVLAEHGVDLDAAIAARDVLEDAAVTACLMQLPSVCGNNVFLSSARLHALVHNPPSRTVYAQLDEKGGLFLSATPPTTIANNPWLPHTLVITKSGVNTFE